MTGEGTLPPEVEVVDPALPGSDSTHASSADGEESPVEPEGATEPSPEAVAETAAAPRSRARRRARPVGPGEATPGAGLSGAGVGPDEPVPAGRPIGIRLARIHLRAGLLALARAELEALAGRGDLDDEALADLAEVRWRTGDLPGAGEAANAAIAHGSADVVALVIAAEAVAALGRPGEARRLAARALKVIDGPLDPVFAGMPRSSVWPQDPDGDASPGPRPGSPTAGAIAGTASVAAASAFAGGRGALAAGDEAGASVRLGIAIRLDPGFAEGVLAAVGERPSSPELALVAGDALRLLGREAEAMEAFDRARGHLVAAASAPSDDVL